MKKFSSGKLAAIMAAAALLSAAGAFTALAEVPVIWTNVSLTEDGDAYWSASYNKSEAVDKYELQLARMKDGGECDLLERLAAEDHFGLSRGEMESLLDPKLYIGRCPEQVTSFLKNDVEPILKMYASELDMEEPGRSF